MREQRPEQAVSEVVPEPLPEPQPGPWSDPLPPTIPESPPQEPDAWPFPEAEPEPEPTPVLPTARVRPQVTSEQQGQRQAALRIADDLGEKEPGPRAQVGRVVRVLGIERAQDFYEQALFIEATGGLMLPDGSRRRTSGGVFFKIVRDGVSKEERWKIFPAPGQGKKPAQPSQPAHAAPAAAPAAAPVPTITELPNATGEARTVKLTLVGRPGRIIAKNGYIQTTMTSSKLPALPKGMPAPPTTPTTYTVYIGQKQWQKVAASLQGNPEDVLIAEGMPAYDPALEGIAVYVTNTTTKLLQQAHPAAQTEVVSQ